MIKKLCLFILIYFAIQSTILHANVTVTTPETAAYVSGDCYIIIELQIDNNGYIYANPKGPGTGKAIQISLLHEGRAVETVLASQAFVKYQPPLGDWVNIYKNRALFYVLIPDHLKNNANTLSVSVEALFCDDDSCTQASEINKVALTESATAAVTAVPDSFILSKTDITDKTDEIADIKTLPPEIDKPEYINQSSVKSLLGAIITGLIAGLFLNIMPCVLPVVSLKLMHLIKSSGKTHAQIIVSSVLYSTGILLTFFLLASLAAFAGHSWGSLFQNQTFIMVMAVIIFAMALSLFGVFTFTPPPFLSSISNRVSGDYTTPLFNGFLATLLSTPCSGPFLGATLAWTLTQPTHVIYAVFLSIGIGLALPFFVITLFPKLISLIPKGGTWTLYSERIFGFILAGSTIYFLSLLNSISLISGLILIWFVSMGLWQLGIFGSSVRSNKSRSISFTVLLVLLTTGIYLSYLFAKPAETNIPSEPYSHAFLKQKLDSGTITAVKFTADWCSNCKYVELTVFNKESVRSAAEKNRVSFLIADISAASTEGEALLQAIGSRSIPFLAIFYPGEGRANPICLDDLYTEEDILKAISLASERTENQNQNEKELTPMIDLTL
jgi:thiol:disulfide interchange protein